MCARGVLGVPLVGLSGAPGGLAGAAAGRRGTAVRALVAASFAGPFETSRDPGVGCWPLLVGRLLGARFALALNFLGGDLVWRRRRADGRHSE